MAANIFLVALFAVCLKPPTGRWEKVSNLWLDVSNGKTVVMFNFVKGERLTSKDVLWICGKTRIDSLDLTRSHVTPCQLKRIFRNVQLGGVDLRYNRLDSCVLELFSMQKGILRVDLQFSGVSPNDLSGLRKCKDLRHLAIGHEKWECSIDVESLSQLNSLQDLHIVAQRISRTELEKLSSLTNLSWLSLCLGEPADVESIQKLRLFLKDRLTAKARLENRFTGTRVSVRPKWRGGPFGWPSPPKEYEHSEQQHDGQGEPVEPKNLPGRKGAARAE